MQWSLVLAVVALLLMLEGMVALFNPDWARRMMQKMAQMSVVQMRMAGLVAISIGVLVLFLLRLSD